MTTRKEFTWDEYITRAEETPYEQRAGVWCGGGFAAAVRMARTDGYAAAVTEVAEVLKAVEETVSAHIMQATFTSTFDVAGSEVDMGRFLGGEPECMLSAMPLQISRVGRAVRLTVNAGYRAEVDEQAIRRRGAAILALVDILARAQHPLEIYTARVTKRPSGQDRLVYSVLVQPANEPLDMGRVMFAVAHPAYHRQICFSAIQPDMPSVGGSCDLTVDDLETLTSGTSIVLAERLRYEEQWSIEDCVRWVEAQVALIFS